MAIVIVDIDSERFSINGINYTKNFISVVSNDLVRILNVYDSRLVLQDNANYADYTVDAASFGSAALLQIALLPVIYNINAAVAVDLSDVAFVNVFNTFLTDQGFNNDVYIDGDIRFGSEFNLISATASDGSLAFTTGGFSDRYVIDKDGNHDFKSGEIITSGTISTTVADGFAIGGVSGTRRIIYGSGSFFHLNDNGSAANVRGFQGLFDSNIVSDATVRGASFRVTALNAAPSSATDTGTVGDIRYTADHIYVCISTNVWKRTAITTW